MWLNLAILLLLPCALAAVEPEIPKTPAGELAGRFIQLVRRGTRNERAKFVKEHYSRRFQEFASEQDHVGMLDRLDQDLKGASLQAINFEEASVALEFARGETSFSVKLVLPPDGEPKIDGVMVGPGEAQAASAKLTQTKVIDAVRSELERRAADDKFSGAVLVAKDGQAVFEAACGYADRENRVTNRVDTKFRFGSMGKMFTGVAVLQLVQSGKIHLEDPIANYLTDYPNQEVAGVTIYQLLTHTGGTGDIFSPEYDARRGKMKELKDYVALYGKRGVQFKPGTDWDYSNYGFILLGRIIEVVSGQSYYDYVRDHIFQPSGMNSTGNAPEVGRTPGLSVGYTGPGGPGLRLMGPGPGPNPGPGPGRAGPGLRLVGPGPGSEHYPAGSRGALRATTSSLPYRGTSAGGGYSTVGDMLKFVNALTSHKLLDAPHTELLVTGKVSTRRPGIKYAFGFEDEPARDGGRCIGHGGGSPGMNGRLSYLPGSHYIVVALANLDPPAADDIARFIRDVLPLK